MVADKLQRFSPIKVSFSTLSLALATATAWTIIGACRLIANIMSIDSTEFDGIVLVATFYWVISLYGYLAPPSTSERKSCCRNAYRVNAAARETCQEGECKVCQVDVVRKSQAPQLVQVACFSENPPTADYCD